MALCFDLSWCNSLLAVLKGLLGLGMPSGETAEAIDRSWRGRGGEEWSSWTFNRMLLFLFLIFAFSLFWNFKQYFKLQSGLHKWYWWREYEPSLVLWCMHAPFRRRQVSTELRSSPRTPLKNPSPSNQYKRKGPIMVLVVRTPRKDEGGAGFPPLGFSNAQFVPANCKVTGLGV